MPAKLPKLLLLSQYAALIGRPKWSVRAAAEKGRITLCQKVGGYVWVFTGDSKIIRKGVDTNDPLIAMLPVEFIAEDTEWHPEEVPERVLKRGNPDPMGGKKVVAWGFNRLAKERHWSDAYVRKATGIHFQTLQRLKRQEPVFPRTVHKLAHYLKVPPIEFIRKDY